MHLRRVTNEAAVQHSDQISSWVKEIADEHTSAAQIFSRLMDGTYEMWLPFDGDRFVGMIINYVNGPVLVLVGAGGNVMNEWEGLHDCFVDLARKHGCSTYEFRGRRGFLRTFKKFGMTEKYTVMECRFEEALCT